MTDEMRVEAEQKLFNDLEDEPCIVCGDPYHHVLGSYSPEEPKRSKNQKDRAPVLYYTLCRTCFNNGRIPTARIESAYKIKFGDKAA